MDLPPPRPPFLEETEEQSRRSYRYVGLSRLLLLRLRPSHCASCPLHHACSVTKLCEETGLPKLVQLISDVAGVRTQQAVPVKRLLRLPVPTAGGCCLVFRNGLNF